MLKWFLDPNGEKLLVDEVLEKGLLNEHFPESYLTMCAKEREWTGKPSTTQLINGSRYEYLRLLTPYAIDPSECAFMIIGTRAHSKLELLAPVGSVAELQIPNDEISGIADLLETYKNGLNVLTDYKTWGSYKVALALGLKKQKRPAKDENGVPILYQRSGPGYTKGDPKMEDFYVKDPDAVDMYEIELQLNRYRLGIEAYYGITIDRLRAFIMVRDGGTVTATSRGIDKNTYFIEVKMLENDYVMNYFNRKRKALLDCMNGFAADMQEKYININSYADMQATEADYDILRNNCPPVCDKRESWNSRRCNGYCPVADVCRILGNTYLKG